MRTPLPTPTHTTHYTTLNVASRYLAYPFPAHRIEYFFSASVQITAVCAVSGIRDAWVLSLVFVSMSVTQLFGLLAELYNQGPAAPDQNNYKTWTLEGQWTRWLPWSLGFLPYFAAYGTLLSNFGVALDDLYREDPDLARRFPTCALQHAPLHAPAHAPARDQAHPLVVQGSTPRSPARFWSSPASRLYSHSTWRAERPASGTKPNFGTPSSA